MKQKIILPILALALLLGGCTKEKLSTTSHHTAPVRLSDYLFEMTYTDYEPSGFLEFLNSIDQIAFGGACSVVRNGDFVGRNLDYYYCEMAETVIHVPAAPGRYASVGVASCLTDFTPEFIEKNPDSHFFDVIPYAVVDGVNEKGVYCSVNLVSFDCGATTGTNPGADTLCATMVVRFVLDHAASAREACEMLSHKNIVQSRLLQEMHYFIADENESYVVEIIHNKLVFAPAPDNILTNFHVLSTEQPSYDFGFERYDLLKEHYAETATKEGMCQMMEQVKCSKMYDTSITPFWYSEYYGNVYKGTKIGINTPHDFYWDFIKDASERYKHRKRDILQFIWHTTHTSVYDIHNRTLRVYSQEDYEHFFEFSL